jgi:predicted small metal-binding protein
MSDEVAESRDAPDPGRFSNSCACGWTVTGSADEVVDATIDHGRRIHNMEATREQVLAVLRSTGADTAEAGG